MWSLVGLDGFAQPVAVALPFSDLPSALGRDLDGIIGAEFIRQFVVEIDYRARMLTLHDRDMFAYTGHGEALPLDFTSNGHPVLDGGSHPWSVLRSPVVSCSTSGRGWRSSFTARLSRSTGCSFRRAEHSCDRYFRGRWPLDRISRLPFRVVEQKGLAYSIQAVLDAYHDVGLFEIDAACAPDKAPDVLSEVLSVVEEMRSDSATDEEIARAKRRQRIFLEFAHDSPGSWPRGSESPSSSAAPRPSPNAWRPRIGYYRESLAGSGAGVLDRAAHRRRRRPEEGSQDARARGGGDLSLSRAERLPVMAAMQRPITVEIRGEGVE